MLRYYTQTSRIKCQWSFLLPMFSLSGLFVLFLIALHPSVPFRVHATEAALPQSNSTAASLEIGGAKIDEETNAIRNAIAYRAHTITIAADSIENYTLTLSGPTNLTGPTGAATTITGAGGKLGSKLDNDTWGYSYGETTSSISQMTFASLPGSEKTIDTGTPSNNAVNQTKNLVFAAKFGPDATAGEYTADVTLSLVVTPKAVVTIESITNMQQMTTDICNATSEGVSKQLKDTRDNKLYWVTRSAKNQCWMTQNLDYDDPNSTKLTSTSGWSSTAGSYRAYYDPGAKMISGTSLVGVGSNTHLHIGNYYSYNSATNGTGGALGSGEATSSICPTNWKLPSQQDFSTLLNTNYQTSSAAFTSAPYYFIIGGRIESSALTKPGESGYYWASNASTSDNAFHLYINSSSISAAFTKPKADGFLVRCLAK